MVDYIPFVSQVKSAIQAIAGDTEGARTTQHNFTRSFPVISQARAGVEVLMGREEDAEETLRQGVAFVDAIPVVGHAKGTIHYICGDKEGGDAAMISASRSTGVMGCAAVAFLVSGPVGAAAAGVWAGTAMDTVTSAVDSAIKGEDRPHGVINAITQIRDDPKNLSHYADLAVLPVMDGMTGFKIGKGVAKVREPGIPKLMAVKGTCKTVKEASESQEYAAKLEKALH